MINYLDPKILNKIYNYRSHLGRSTLLFEGEGINYDRWLTARNY